MSASSMLLVTAHPDDEVLSFGGLVYLAARAGTRITLVCATRGEVGQIADPRLATPDTLAAVREAELRAACSLLGIADLRILDYRDSGMAGDPANQDPRAFCNADPDDVVPRLVGIIRQTRPLVVLTWDGSGGSGHPDHVAASRHATAAFDLAGQPVLPQAGPPFAPTALYYAARPRELRDEVRAALVARGVPNERAASGPDDLATAERSTATVTLDVLPALAVKRAARAAHRTQGSPMARIELLPADLQRRYAGTEYFHRARPQVQDGAPDTLLQKLLSLDTERPARW